MSNVGKIVSRVWIQTHNPWIDNLRCYRLSYMSLAQSGIRKLNFKNSLIWNFWSELGERVWNNEILTNILKYAELYQANNNDLVGENKILKIKNKLSQANHGWFSVKDFKLLLFHPLLAIRTFTTHCHILMHLQQRYFLSIVAQYFLFYQTSILSFMEIFYFLSRWF